MPLPASLRYLVARLRHQDTPALTPYLREGLGIETRARRLAIHWRPHLDASRAAQIRWNPPGNTLAVLGAGRLFDLSPNLASNFPNLKLVDIDPLCQPFWRKAYPHHESIITDITGCLTAWTPHPANWQQTLNHIRNRRADPPAHPWLQDADAILSLNLLGQIPLAWHQSVETHLRRRFGASYIKQREDEWHAAVEPGARSLIDAHLAMLSQVSRARRILIITDLTYLEYAGAPRNYSRGQGSEPPLQWHDGTWAGGSPSLVCQACPALYGLEKPTLPNFREAWCQHWLWHISPQGTEPPAKGGSIHLVGAFCFER